MRCWPGCLAWIRYDPCYAENVGRIVTVVQRALDHEAAVKGGVILWTCQARAPLRVNGLRQDGTVIKDGRPATAIVVPDLWLIPIGQRPANKVTVTVKMDDEFTVRIRELERKLKAYYHSKG